MFTGEDVTAGQQVFLKNGLMQYGSIFGHGAYLGPDYTAGYVRRSALLVRDSYGGEDSGQAAARTVEDFRENRYDPGTRTLGFTGAQAAAFEELRGYYGGYFGEPTTKYGLRPEAISDPEEIRQLTAFFRRARDGGGVRCRPERRPGDARLLPEGIRAAASLPFALVSRFR